MSESASEPVPNPKRFKRRLTTFLCQEMLYDFATDQLDPERRQAVEEFLQKDKECRDLLEGIRASLDYSKRLAETSLQPSVLEQLRHSENALSLGRHYSKWESWPETVRWSIMAVAASICFAAIVAVIPWQKIQFGSASHPDAVIVAKIPEPTSEQLKTQQEGNEVDALAANESSGDEGPDQEASDSGDSEEAGAPKIVAPPASAAKLAEAEKAPAPTPAVVMAKVQPPAAKPALAPAVVAKAASADASSANEADEKSSDAAAGTEKKAGKPKGFVYRAFMHSADLETVGPKVTEAIQELGGAKAGEVELGWKRGNSVRYYHFSLPAENEEKLIEQLQTYGPVRISKDPHSRVMPEGQVRFILWLEAN